VLALFRFGDCSDVVYLRGGRLSCVDSSCCPVGTDGAALWGTALDELPGGFGAGRKGIHSPLFVRGLEGELRPSPCGVLPDGVGAALGFSKLSGSFLGNRGLEGGLPTGP